jgi:serine-type D-Ala-D-Ala carboxypeptidase/endopeptidase (penicillin-binding protein 4)
MAKASSAMAGRRTDRPLAVSAARGALSLAGVFVIAGMVVSCTAQQPAGTDRRGGVPGLPDAAAEVMSKPQYANGRWLMSVIDLETEEVLVDLDSDRMTEPASFVKSYSVGAAWMTWGPDSTITTPVKRSGEVSDGGVLDGNLVLVGKGDITMGGRTRPDGTVDFTDLDHNDANPLPGATLTEGDPLAGLDDLAAQVKASGVDAVRGDVIIDDRLFEGDLEGQPVSPIVVNQNLVDIVLTPGDVGETASAVLTPAVAPWRVTSEVETVAAGGLSAVSDPELRGDAELVLRGTIAADSAPRLKVHAFDDPATFARTAFIEALGRAGVAVSADPLAVNSTSSLPAQEEVDGLPSVAEFESLPLEEHATYIMKISYNRGAQTFACLLAVAAGETECDAGIAEAGRIWADAGLTTTGASLVDASGLAGNYVTPDNAVDVQKIMAGRPDFDRWKSTLPVLGVDGSLAAVQVDSPAAGKVFAKTGTLVEGDAFNGRLRVNTKALGGVIEAESGRNLAFMIVMNNGFATGIEGVLEANDDVGRIAAIIQQHY